jgi:hypothetical protein
MTEGPPIDISRKLSPEEMLEFALMFLEATEPEEFHPVKAKENVTDLSLINEGGGNVE